MKRLVGKLQTMADLVNFFYSSSSSKRTITWAKLHGSWVVIHVLQCMAHAHQTWCIMMTHVKKESYVQSMWVDLYQPSKSPKAAPELPMVGLFLDVLPCQDLGRSVPCAPPTVLTVLSVPSPQQVKVHSRGRFRRHASHHPWTRPGVRDQGWFFLESMNELLPEFIHNHCVMTCIKGISKYPCILQSFRHLSTQKATFWLEQPGLLLKNWTSLEKHHSNLKFLSLGQFHSLWLPKRSVFMHCTVLFIPPFLFHLVFWHLRPKNWIWPGDCSHQPPSLSTGVAPWKWRHDSRGFHQRSAAGLNRSLLRQSLKFHKHQKANGW